MSGRHVNCVCYDKARDRQKVREGVHGSGLCVETEVEKEHPFW